MDGWGVGTYQHLIQAEEAGMEAVLEGTNALRSCEQAHSENTFEFDDNNKNCMGSCRIEHLSHNVYEYQP